MKRVQGPWVVLMNDELLIAKVMVDYVVRGRGCQLPKDAAADDVLEAWTKLCASLLPEDAGAKR